MMRSRAGQRNGDRKHPRRLDAALYGIPDWPVSVTFRATSGHTLTEATVVDALIGAMRYCSRRWQCRVAAYCIMPDHLHVLVVPEASSARADQWVRYFKGRTAHALGRAGMWQRSYWDRHVRDEEGIVAVAEYILMNPVRRGLCAEWAEWPHSWSQWLPGAQRAPV